MSDTALFDIEPAALIYTRDSGVGLHRMKCRECHRMTKSPVGWGFMDGHQYAICEACFKDGGDLGKRARRGGWKGREVIVYGPGVAA